MTKAEYNRAYYIANKEKVLLQVKQYRDTHDSLPEFVEKRRNYYQSNRDSILEKKRIYTAKTRDSKKLYNKAYAVRNKAKIAENNRIWRLSNKERVNSNNRKYWNKNPSKFKSWKDKWKKKNPGKQRAYWQGRRARELKATRDNKSVNQFYGWVGNQDVVDCVYCGTFLPGGKVHIDHIIPLSKGGEHSADNLCVSCPKCNQSKIDKLLSEWGKCPEKIRRILGMI